MCKLVLKTESDPIEALIKLGEGIKTLTKRIGEDEKEVEGIRFLMTVIANGIQDIASQIDP